MRLRAWALWAVATVMAFASPAVWAADEWWNPAWSARRMIQVPKEQRWDGTFAAWDGTYIVKYRQGERLTPVPDI